MALKPPYYLPSVCVCAGFSVLDLNAAAYPYDQYDLGSIASDFVDLAALDPTDITILNSASKAAGKTVYGYFSSTPDVADFLSAAVTGTFIPAYDLEGMNPDLVDEDSHLKHAHACMLLCSHRGMTT